MTDQLALNQKRADEAIAKYDKLCKVKQAYEKDKPHPVSCTCTEVQGNMNCKFNNW